MAATPTAISTMPRPNNHPHKRWMESSSAATAERKNGNPVGDIVALPGEESWKGDAFHYLGDDSIWCDSIRRGLVAQDEPVPQAVWGDGAHVTRSDVVATLEPRRGA